MPFVDLNTIIVTGTYLDFEDLPYRGWVYFDPPADLGPLLDANGVEIIMPSRISVRLDSNGHISVALPATNDPDVTPTGWLYTVTEYLIGTDGAYPNVYTLAVPFDAIGGTFDLSGRGAVLVGANQMTLHSGQPLQWHSGQNMDWET